MLTRITNKLRTDWKGVLLLLGLWTLVAIITTSQIVLEVLSYNRPIDHWPSLVIIQLLKWYFWFLITPLIVWLGRRFRIERQRWFKATLVHLFVSFVIGATHLWILVVSSWYLDPNFVGRRSAIRLPHPLINRFMELSFNSHVELLVYWAILGSSYAIEYYRKYRERELLASQLEAQLSQAQLQALKMQLHPHFLFNTLNAIAGLVRSNKNKDAVTMIAGLSDLLRHVLEQAGRQEVTLREELDFLELYLDIQQMRFSDRLKVQMHVDPRTLNAQVPNLVLQPLVENAIRHGVSKNTGESSVIISADRAGDSLRITVFNSGPALKQINPSTGNTGIGLSNTRARLQRLYGELQSLRLQNVEGGVSAEITIPFRNDARAMETINNGQD